MNLHRTILPHTVSYVYPRIPCVEGCFRNLGSWKSHGSDSGAPHHWVEGPHPPCYRVLEHLEGFRKCCMQTEQVDEGVVSIKSHCPPSEKKSGHWSVSCSDRLFFARYIRSDSVLTCKCSLHYV